MAYSSERWSRGCGTGIGLSSAKNQYRLGVSIDNWVEEDYAQQEDAKGQANMWGTGEKTVVNFSTTQSSFTEAGKYGPAVLEHADRKDYDAPPPIPHFHKFAHGLDPGTYKDITHFGTLNALTYAEPSFEKPKVQAGMFQGSKLTDFRVPKDVGTGKLVAARKARLEEERNASMYTTMNETMLAKSAAEAHATYAAGGTFKRALAAPSADGGQASQIGRKATGQCVGVYDQVHQVTMLRGRKG